MCLLFTKPPFFCGAAFDGDVMTIPVFLKSYFNFKPSMLGPIVAILIAYSACFIGISIFAFQKFNFQSR